MKNLLNELRFFGFRWTLNLRNAQALRWNFILQMIGMFINDIAFFVIWLLFSHAIGVVNGWGMLQTLGLLSFSIFIYGITDTLFGSTHLLYDVVPDGRFDSYLTKPKNLYTRILNDDFAAGGLGDLVQGLIGLIIFFAAMDSPWHDIAIMAVMIPSAIIAMVAFLASCNCISFWIPQSSLISTTLKDLFYLPSTQPLSLLRGKMRFFYMVIVPVLIVSGMPVEVVTYRSYGLIAVAYAISLSWLALSIFLLNKSVRRYESGNVIG